MTVGDLLLIIHPCLWLALIFYVVRFYISSNKKEREMMRKKTQLVIGREYMIRHEESGWIEAVYLGLDFDGYRHFNNLDTGEGMCYKTKDPEVLFYKGKVKYLNTQSPVPTREFDKRYHTNQGENK